MKIKNHDQPQEVSISCSFWEPIGASGLLTRDDGRPREDHGDSKLGSIEECVTATHYFGTYGVLQKVYQRIFLDHRANGEIVEEGCHVLPNDDCKKSLDILKENMVTVLIIIFPN